MWVIFVQIPVMARPRTSSGFPLCNSGEGCDTKDTVSPPAAYAVQRFPVRHARGDAGWGGRVSAGHRMPLYVFPMRPRGDLPGDSVAVPQLVERTPSGISLAIR